MSREIIARINQELQSGKGLVLTTILKRIGSAPMSGGSRMLVFSDHTIFGTIGGGSLEAKVRESAIEVLKTKLAQIQDYSFTGKDAASMDMICGGTVTILIEWLEPGDQQLNETIEKLASFSASTDKCWWIQAVDPRLRVMHGCFAASWDAVWGVDLSPESVHQVHQVSWLETSQASCFIERLNQMGTVLIFGAGHVAQPVAHLCHLVDFGTIVIDDRPEYANRERFPDADEILVSGLYESMVSERVTDDSSYVVIVTRGHLNDQVVLESALKTSAGYIGMIGSKRKWKLLRDELIAKGYSEAYIARVHTPIGLDIGAETPAEIAVSIAAELVKARAGRLVRENSAGHS